MAVTSLVWTIACSRSHVIAQTGSQASESEATADSTLKFARMLKDVGKLEEASKLYGLAMNQSSRDDSQLKQTLLIALQYAESLDAIGANTEAVCIYNSIGRAVSDPMVHFARAVLFLHLDWDSAMFSELRTAHRLDRNNPAIVGGLAAELLLTEQPELRNPQEALAVALSARDQIENAPYIAEMIATAAAATKDFDLAVKMQTQYLKSGAVSEEDLPIQNRSLQLYKLQAGPLIRELPRFARHELLGNNAIMEIARRTMVGIRIQGVVEGRDSQTGNVQVRASTQWAIGTVLDSFGTILLSSESVRVPTYGELFSPETQEIGESSVSFLKEEKRTDVVGSTRWLESPEIEIFSMPMPKVQSKSLGNAVLMGTDTATGVAVIELKRSSAFGFVRHSEWTAARFAPEYRSIDPNADQLVSGLELDYTPTDYITVPNLVTLESCEPKILAYCECSSGDANTARLIALPGSKTPLGSALFNQLGEIVGIKHQVAVPGTDGRANGQVAIPAAVCTRIAAKLAAYGEVHRTYLPFDVNSKTTGVEAPAMGMRVSKVPADVRIYQPLVNKFIVSLNEMPTPTMTEWLHASEQVHDRGLDTALVEVYDPETNLVTWMTLPTVKP
jgi:hypothetical protein